MRQSVFACVLKAVCDNLLMWFQINKMMFFECAVVTIFLFWFQFAGISGKTLSTGMYFLLVRLYIFLNIIKFLQKCKRYILSIIQGGLAKRISAIIFFIILYTKNTKRNFLRLRSHRVNQIFLKPVFSSYDTKF